MHHEGFSALISDLDHAIAIFPINAKPRRGLIEKPGKGAIPKDGHRQATRSAHRSHGHTEPGLRHRRSSGHGRLCEVQSDRDFGGLLDQRRKPANINFPRSLTMNRRTWQAADRHDDGAQEHAQNRDCRLG